MSSQTLGNTNLVTVMKDISEALSLDRNDKLEDAYRKYLECVLRITTKLLMTVHKDGGHLVVSREVSKFVKLGQQCMDRVGSLINERYDANIMPAVPSGSMSLPLRQGTVQTPTTPSPLGVTSPGEVLSPTGRISTHRISGTGSVTSPDENQNRVPLQGPLTSLSEDQIAHNRKRQKKMTPMELAVLQNQQLLKAFRARQTKTGSKSVNANLSLTLQRKMAENLAIGKAQEQALALRMKERQQRLEEQAARRFHTPIGLSAEEQEQRQIYRRVLEFEQEEITMYDWRKRLEENPSDVNTISQLLLTILSYKDHPLTQQLELHQNKILHKLQPLVEGKQQQINCICVPLPDTVFTTIGQYKTTFSQSEEDSGDQSDVSSQGAELGRQSDCASPKTVGNKQISEHLKDENGESDEERQTKFIKSTDKCSAAKGYESDTNVHLTNDKNIEDISSDVKNNLKVAMIKGKALRESLEQENKNVKSLIRQVSADYEAYNEENMDDLFDDEDEEVFDSGGPCYSISEEDSSICSSIEGTQSKPEADDISSDTDNKSTSQNAAEEDKENQAQSVKNPNYAKLEANIKRLRNEACHRHLEGISEDIISSIERLQVLFVVMYEQLDSAEGRDQCNLILEATFFRPLWAHVLSLFRLSNEPKEIAIAYIMTKHQSASPQEFGVREELCLSPSEDKKEDYAYSAAITELSRLPDYPAMLPKLDCLVKTSRLVIKCVEQYYTATDKVGSHTPSIGADDLLPVLCYVLARCRLPQLVSECHAMGRFIHEGYMFGEEGYCLTSFQTAINYLISLGMKA